MNEDLWRRLQIDVQELQDLMRGKGMDGGVINALLSLGNVVHGTKENPGGLVKRVEEQENKIDKLYKIVYMGMGAAGVINVGWMVFIHFHK